MKAATEGSLPPVLPEGNLVEVLGREVRQGSPGELMVESTPSRQRRPPCKTNKEEADEAADAAALTYLLTQLGITEPLPKPALASPSPGLSTLADNLKRSRVSWLLPKVTCPCPFHPGARTVPIAELQDVPVTETEKRGLSALAPLAGVPPPPSGLTPGGGKSGRPIAQANIQLELPEFDPKNLPERAEEFAEFLLLTGQSHVDVATKCSLLKR